MPVICGICKTLMIEHVCHYECPDCGSEFYPASKDLGMNSLWEDQQSYVRKLTKPGSKSSNSGGRKRKREVKPKIPGYQT